MINSKQAICVDFETTSTEFKQARIIEIGAVKWEIDSWLPGLPERNYSQLVALPPEQRIPEKIVKITNITDSMLAGAPQEKEALEEFIDTMLHDNPIMLGHNIYYDASVFVTACRRNNIFPPSLRCYDTLELFRYAFSTHAQHKLSYLVEQMNVHVRASHRAHDDCQATFELLRVACQRLDMRPRDVFEHLWPIPNEPYTLATVAFLAGEDSTYWVPKRES